MAFFGVVASGVAATLVALVALALFSEWRAGRRE